MQTIEYKSGREKQVNLYELKTVAEWVVDIKALEAADGVIFDHLDIVLLKALAERGYIHDADSGMCLGCGSEVFLDTDMQLVHAALQPNAAATV
jgi:hypothetical protein